MAEPSFITAWITAATRLTSDTSPIILATDKCQNNATNRVFYDHAFLSRRGYLQDRHHQHPCKGDTIGHVAGRIRWPN